MTMATLTALDIHVGFIRMGKSKNRTRVIDILGQFPPWTKIQRTVTQSVLSETVN